MLPRLLICNCLCSVVQTFLPSVPTTILKLCTTADTPPEPKMFAPNSKQQPSGSLLRRLLNSRGQLVLLGLMALAVFALWPSGHVGVSRNGRAASDTQVKAARPAEKILVELFVMSQCPDGRHCEQAFLPVAEKLQSISEVRTEYIARLGDNNKVNCMHGQGECEGNKQQLCLQHYVPADKNLEWFYKTLLCHGDGDVSSIKHLTSCMARYNLPSEIINKVLGCVNGTEGVQLQVQSAQELQNRQVTRSCTIYIAGERRCIRDGGRSYDCPGGDSESAFIQTVCNAYKAKTGQVASACVKNDVRNSK